MKQANATILFVIFLASALLQADMALSASLEERSESEVWSREDDYWRFVKAGDVESYRTLWHENFIGWPCGEDHALRKSRMAGWVQEIRNKKISYVSTLTREGAQAFGSVVVVHYRVAAVSTYPDGRQEGRGQESKITHTWMKVGNTWQIVGGMCASLAQAKK